MLESPVGNLTETFVADIISAVSTTTRTYSFRLLSKTIEL